MAAVNAPNSGCTSAGGLVSRRWRRSILARFPHYKLDRSTFTSASDPINIDCPIHDVRFRARPLDIVRIGVPVCPECRAEHRRNQRRAERRDPHAEHNLRRIAAELRDLHVNTYRHWLNGETLLEIGQGDGFSAEAIRRRLKRVEELLDAGTADTGE